MKARLNVFQVAPEGLKPIVDMEHYIRDCHQTRKTLDHGLIELVKTRVSQINGCAYCLDMHTKDARHFGESEQRLYALSAWRETPFFSEKERAALAWAEANTLISQTGISDDLYDQVRQQFSEPELVDLTLVVTNINAWNRLAISFKSVPGPYQPGDFDF